MAALGGKRVRRTAKQRAASRLNLAKARAARRAGMIDAKAVRGQRRLDIAIRREKGARAAVEKLPMSKWGHGASPEAIAHTRAAMRVLTIKKRMQGIKQPRPKPVYKSAYRAAKERDGYRLHHDGSYR